MNISTMRPILGSIRWLCLAGSILLLTLTPLKGNDDLALRGLENFFDGSLQGDAGEAAVDRNQGPGYYHFTLEGLSAFQSLEYLRVATIPHEGHSSRRLNMWVYSSVPSPEDDELPGYDFSLRDETELTYNYYREDGELIEGDVSGRNINQTGWIEVPLDHLSMENERTFRMAFESGFRGAASLPYVEVTGILPDGSEAATIVRYDFDQEGSRAEANQTHSGVDASIMWPQGFPLPQPIVSIEHPEGDLTMVQLQFAIPDGPESFRDWVHFSGMRNNVLPMDHWVGVSQPGGSLTREGDQLTGTFERQHRGEQPYTLSVDATIDGNAISGTVTLTDDNPWTGTGESWTGTVSGTMTPEASLRAENAISSAANWPRFTGPDGAGNAAQVRGLSTITSLDDIRFQWASEAIDIGQGIGSLNRFAYNFSSGRKRSGGASSSPVVVDGKVYFYYSVPSPRVYNYFHRAREFTSGHRSFEGAAERMAEQGEERELFTGGPEDLPVPLLEKIWEAADDVVICMDAATGQTLWRARIENVGYNRQHHKEGPYNQTVAVHGDRVFSIGSGGWLHALDRHSGEALWHHKVGGEHTHEKQAVLAIEEAVIIPKDDRWAGFDPASGEQLWRREDLSLNNVSIPEFWRAGDGTPVAFVYGSGSSLVGLHAATGETLFTYALEDEEGFVGTRFASGSGRAGNPNNLAIHGNALVTHETDESRDERWGVGVYDIALSGLTPRWRVIGDGWIRGEWSPLVMKDRWVVTSPSARGIMAFDIETGELMSEAGQDDVQEYTPGSNGLLMGMEDLVISQRDMTHGQIDITFFKIDELGQLTNLNPDGHMLLASGRGTGSYHHPVMQAVVDGRIFMRERRGLMSYDLRDHREAPEVNLWPEPSGIDFGETLEDVELVGGEPSVDGTFAFKRPDTMPEPGTALFMLVFYPSDSETYRPVETAVMVTVNRIPPEIELTAPGQICPNQAIVGANLLQGDASTGVSVWFGLEDGGSDEANWAEVLPLGIQETGPIEATLTNLGPNSTYYYRFVASNPEESTQTATASLQTPPLRASLVTPTTNDIRIPEGVALILEVELSENGDPITLDWQKASGDGDVTWENAAATQTAVWFSAQGEYHLQFVANDGTCIQTLNINVEVVDPLLLPDGDGQGNIGPLALAGENRMVSAGSPFQFDGQAIDDGLPESPGLVITEWTLLSTPGGEVSIDDPNQLNSFAEVSEEGEYTFRLTAFDGEIKTADDLTVTASPSEQLVFITEPILESVVGEAYFYEIQIGGGEEANLTLESGDLPSWLTLEEGPYPRTWILSGTPDSSSADQAYPIELTADDENDTATQSFTLRAWPEGSVLGSPQIRGRPVAELTSYSAEARAELLGGDAPIVVHLWFGTSDGGDNPSGWDEVIDLGSMDVGDIAHPLTDLDDETTYFYRFSAENLIGQQSTDTETFETLKDLTGIHPEITLLRPTVNSVRIPEGVGLVLETEVTESGGESGELTLAWELVSGDGTVTWDNNSEENTAVWFSAQGSYVLRLTADNGVNSDVLEIAVEVVDPELITEIAGTNGGAAGEGGYSGLLPIGWVAENINDPSIPGELTWNVNGALLTGARGDIWDEADTFHYVYTTVTGDVELKARVASLEGIDGDPNDWAKAGPMIRETATPGSKMGLSTFLGDGRSAFYHRTETDGDAARPDSTPDLEVGSWVRIQRAGDEIIASYSADGESWTAYDPITISMGSEVTVGLAASSHTSSTIMEVLFDQVHLNGQFMLVWNPNIGPLVNAGEAQTVDVGQELTLSGTVEDDGLPEDPGTVTTEWVNPDQSPIVIAESENLNSNFTFNQTGEWRLWLKADDGEIKTVSEVWITVEAGDGYSAFDSWLIEHGLEEENLAEYRVLKGGREVTLEQAFLLGNDPHDNNDIIRPLIVKVEEGDFSMELRFQALPDRFYQVQVSESLSSESWLDYGDPISVTSEEVRTIGLDMDTDNYPRLFYRIRILYPEW